MGDLIIQGTGRMTSLEIATLTGKKHDKVMRDIDKLFIDLGLDNAKFGDIYSDSGGRSQKMYSLDKRLSLALVSGYSAKLRIAIIDRWEQLEAKKPLTQLEIVVQSAQILGEQSKKLEEHDQRILQLEAHNKTSDFDYYTISGYCGLKGFKHIALSDAMILGKACTKLSKELDYEVKKVYDPRYTWVNVYHIDILAKVVV